ncbi:ppGpp synthetase catalytic domain-containing protein (RelA/SpoT-type nucleotidyltranferase) [Trichlorobacter thiogenes]|uniref:PpGpp synthetase catalytic domain-containing protein (RelA/SpoT-type nucleotidyltranferase) n=1 Tax=Trichlorobacter thiogenes TaxID=115783 RepID=A0A1T4Q8F8_9BACT|nr:hypothetical protein [Trichlorobacter thiogenes]SKA00043.1 ppGpp synthetase catalytic domain-containing protein (RelA/SpoT-type nucleotidyltranferase) [Trichlorobacter thiogenes]
MDIQSLRQKYEEMRPRLERLGNNIKAALEQFLEQNEIDVFGVSYRVKDFESFYEKIERKQYKDPFEQDDDLCGIRIIAFYPTDIERIEKIIKDEFIIHDFINKENELNADQFGYRSSHLIVTISEDWLTAPNYRGLKDIRAEIQVRTILMHAWANISHNLSYKSKDQVPPQFLRRIFQLSALFEMADQEFDLLRSHKIEYQQTLVRNAREDSKGFDTSQPLNIDILQAFLDFYFPNRHRELKETEKLLSEMQKLKVTLKDLEKGRVLSADFMNEDEKASFDGKKGHQWAQVGVARHILDLTSDNYWKSRSKDLPEHISELVEKTRKRIKVAKSA